MSKTRDIVRSLVDDVKEARAEEVKITGKRYLDPFDPRYSDSASRKRSIKQLQKQISDLDAGSDVSFDMAMNDKGASVRRLQVKKDELHRQLKKLQGG